MGPCRDGSWPSVGMFLENSLCICLCGGMWHLTVTWSGKGGCGPDSPEWVRQWETGFGKSGQPHPAVQKLAGHEIELSKTLRVVTCLGIF